MRIALEAGARVVGVNNRNLHTFEMDLETTERVALVAASMGVPWQVRTVEGGGGQRQREKMVAQQGRYPLSLLVFSFEATKESQPKGRRARFRLWSRWLRESVRRKLRHHEKYACHICGELFWTRFPNTSSPPKCTLFFCRCVFLPCLSPGCKSVLSCLPVLSCHPFIPP